MRPLGRRWVWAAILLWHLAVCIPFWRYSQEAPLFRAHGDVYRGWPWVYGLDQGDVIGDEWLFFITYFRPMEFMGDTAVAIACGLPVSAGTWIAWRWRRRAALAKLAYFNEEYEP